MTTPENQVDNLEQIENLEVTNETMTQEIEQSVSELEEYQKYLNGEFKEAAHDFIYKCGLLTPTLSVDDPMAFIQKVNVQMNQVKEELSEILAAIDLDKKEHIDGHVDSMFVILNLIEMNKYLITVDEELLSEHLNVDKLQLIGNIFEHVIAYPLPKDIKDQEMLIAAMRIVENNKLKYTTDYQEARGWRIPVGGRKEGVKLQKVNYNGVNYYSLVDKDGKIRKHRDFVKVDLSDLVSEG